jgi:hypothetical protein
MPGPRWSELRRKRPIKCDDCVRDLHEAKGVGPAPRNARWLRDLHGTVSLLCGEHAQRQRDIDFTREKGIRT